MTKFEAFVAVFHSLNGDIEFDRTGNPNDPDAEHLFFHAGAVPLTTAKEHATIF